MFVDISKKIFVSNLSSALKTIFVDENNIGVQNPIESDRVLTYINDISKKSIQPELIDIY